MLTRKIAAAMAATAAFAAINVMAYAEWKEIDTNQGPPAMRTETMPAARTGEVWVPGYYEYKNRTYSWVPGRFEKERAGYTFSAPRYEQKNGRWGMYAGGWEEGVNTRDKVSEITKR